MEQPIPKPHGKKCTRHGNLKWRKYTRVLVCLPPTKLKTIFIFPGFSSTPLSTDITRQVSLNDDPHDTCEIASHYQTQPQPSALMGFGEVRSLIITLQPNYVRTYTREFAHDAGRQGMEEFSCCLTQTPSTSTTPPRRNHAHTTPHSHARPQYHAFVHASNPHTSKRQALTTNVNTTGMWLHRTSTCFKTPAPFISCCV